MQEIQLNIIPFSPTITKLEVGLFKEKTEGYASLHKGEYPKELWEQYESELKEIAAALIEFSGDVMGNAVPDMLDILNALRFLNRISKVFRHVFQETAPFDHVVRRVLEQIEKRFFPRYETEHNVLSSCEGLPAHQSCGPG